MNFERKMKLPRLPRAWYKGRAFVHWTNTVIDRAPGWLTPEFHAAFRETTLHASAREKLICPAYCLMPDHLHLVWIGLSGKSDQIKAMRFLRKYLKPALGKEGRWQHQPHDHVLREDERSPDAFAAICHYVLANPVRAGLVQEESEWEYSGAIVPGYPDLNPLAENYWDLFWRLYQKNCEPDP